MQHDAGDMKLSRSAHGRPDAELLAQQLSSIFSHQKRTTLLCWCHTHAQKCAAVAGSGACVAMYAQGGASPGLERSSDALM
jgi:hypothetical protein